MINFHHKDYTEGIEEKYSFILFADRGLKLCALCVILMVKTLKNRQVDINNPDSGRQASAYRWRQ